MSKLSMGKTTFHCRQCQTVTVVENLDLEKMTEFRCGNCGVPMSEPRFLRLKLGYYAKLYLSLTEPPFAGEGPEMFKVDMEFNPHYERNHDELDD